jgi:hypothetical protein
MTKRTVNIVEQSGVYSVVNNSQVLLLKPFFHYSCLCNTKACPSDQTVCFFLITLVSGTAHFVNGAARLKES